MIKNYWTLALRNLKKNSLFSLINVLGLAVGLACCLTIFLYVKNEISYDRFHKKADRIYQVIYTTSSGIDLAQVPPPISPLMESFHPEVAASARMFRRNISVNLGKEGQGQQFEEENVFFADSAIFDIFSFDILAGDIKSFLQKNGTVWLNEDLAKKYFPSKDPLGETIYINGSNAFKIAGILKDFPSSSHLHFNMLIPWEDMYNLEKEPMAEIMKENLSKNWVISHSFNYVLLKEGYNPGSVNARFDDMVQSHAPEGLRLGQQFRLESIKDIHLLANVELQPEPLGNRQYIYIFSGIAFLTLLIACFNYINLSTAQSIKRSKEVGMRKVLGARKTQLFGQCLSESIILSLIAFLIAIGLVFIALPLLNEISNTNLSLNQLIDLRVVGGFLLIFLFTSLLGGSYPSFIISNGKALEIIKGKLRSSQSRFSLKRVLVMLQFAISIMLIAGSILIFRQLEYFKNRPLGFQTEAVINIPILSASMNNIFGGIDSELRQRLNVFSERIKDHPYVKATTISSTLPGIGTIGRYITVEGKDPNNPEIIYNLQVDYDFIQAYGLEILAGRDFSKEAGTDHMSSVIINETAIRNFEWENPENAIGKEVDLEGKKARVIGVVKDFHTTSLHNAIQPLVIDVHVPGFNTLSVIAVNGKLPETISFLEEQWMQYFPEKTFEYNFLDTEIKELYQAENRLGKIIGIFASMAIFVSCMGAYGLMMFTTQQRQKEMGIRKVLGASIFQLVALLLKEFSLLLIIGFLIGVPVTWWWGTKWLEDFSYKAAIDPVVFIFSGILCLILVWLTVSVQTFKTALCNPTTVLRDE